MPMKYLVTQTPEGEAPVLFPEHMYHDRVQDMLGRPDILAAGLVDFAEGKLRCHGHSLSLGISSRGTDDDVLLQIHLRPRK